MAEILCDQEMPLASEAECYQESDWPALAVAASLLVAASITLVLPLGLNGWSPAWWLVFPALAALGEGLIARWAWGSFRASRAPTGWRLRWTAEGLCLRFRSPLNHRFPPETPAVLCLPRRSVAWLRVHQERMNAPDGEGGTYPWRQGWLEIGLKRVNAAPIKAALAGEAKLRDPGGGRHNDTPVVLVAEDRLRVKLRHPEKAAARMARLYPVTLATANDTSGIPDLTAEDKEAQIISLAEAGQVVAAIKAARALYGHDLTEAKAFVDGLMGR